MEKYHLRSKPLQTAMMVHALLGDTSRHRDLNSTQGSVWLSEIKAIEKIISLIRRAYSPDDWERIRELIVEFKKNSGSSVDDEARQSLSNSVDSLLREVLDSYRASSDD